MQDTDQKTVMLAFRLPVDKRDAFKKSETLLRVSQCSVSAL